ncbi:monooxygenase [Paenibacillus sp. FSL H8-0548]|uniref:NAD(P)/FAD-dependent oxidoreductase n=1 Tax=Paenibacillus sp. FSL H8-0548 TaxID=1920422 RepID=UPI00096FA416|nr:NAD(P)/FAD-dependent oxidoreductase [Paenibacillus sp. FSL H8-0548]OMF22541.1 monooxygenase [Paenibacillus sp. FSL H8-0548]
MVDVAVLGAGLAGSSAAKALADKGWETLLLDRQSFPRHKVCGEFLSPEAQSTLQALGLGDSIAELGHSELERVRLIFENGAEVDMALPGKAWGISRYSLDAALHQAAAQAGAALQTGRTVTSVRATDRGFLIQTKQGREVGSLEARAVIAAWGASQRTELAGYLGQPARKPSYIGVKSHFRGIAMEPVVELYFFRGGYLGLCPVEDGLVNASALLERGAVANTGKTILTILGGAAQRNKRLFEKLKHAEPVLGSQAAVAPVYLNRKLFPWDQQLPLLGDTSGMIPPLCGDGMSMALRSAALCVPLADRYLRGQLSMAEWELAYTRSINREFKGPLRWGAFLQWLFGMTAVTDWLPHGARLAPGIVQGLWQATRLKPFQL